MTLPATLMDAIDPMRSLVRDVIAALPKCNRHGCWRPSLIVDGRDYYHESYCCLEHTESLRDKDGGLQLDSTVYAAPWAEAVMRAVEMGVVPWA